MQLIISPLWTVIVTVLHLAIGQAKAFTGREECQRATSEETFEHDNFSL